MARFIFDFREYDQAGQPNPYEDWRPFYNYLIREDGAFVGPYGRSFLDRANTTNSGVPSTTGWKLVSQA